MGTVAWGWEDGDGCIRTGASGRERQDRSVRIGVWGWELGDNSVGMGG